MKLNNPAVKKRPSQLPRSGWLSLLLLVLVGLLFTAFSLTLSSWHGVSWLQRPVLFWINALPVVLALLFLWLLTGFAWLSCLVVGVLLFLLTGANYFKLQFRDDPMVWADLLRLREGWQMAGQYEVSFTPLMYLWIGVILASVALLFYWGRGRFPAVARLLSLTATGMLLLVGFNELAPQNDWYVSLAGDHAGSETEAYVACGMIYPFLHSAGAGRDYLDTYNPNQARAILSGYSDGEIPEEKKVNLVSIQLEAYVDLSLYDVDGLSPEVFRPLHILQDKSYTGTLVTDIFAGGTTETEWAFLTGGNYHGDFKVKTDSFAWYLKDQGYTVNGSHPCRDWFYDRKHVNPNLGLDDYLFTDNYFYQFIDRGADVAYDNIFFPDLTDRLDQYFQKEDEPLFSFNVTYQGHGPYNEKKTYWGDGYCTGDYPQTARNILNNYFYLMQNTGEKLLHFTDYLETVEKPVVLVLYSDHKPWLGNHNSVYELLDISLDTSTEEGFLNYYSTWYLIWANPAAKEVLGNDFIGQGPDLSPCFLMDHIFQLFGWEGPAYMQAQRETAQALPVLHTTGWVKEEGAYTRTPSPAAQTLVERFQHLSLYDRHRFD